jgi:hypothetical protein
VRPKLALTWWTWSALGPRDIKIGGPPRARPVMTGMNEPQVIAPAHPRPRTPEQGGSGFESHLTAARPSGPCQQGRRHRRRASPCRRGGAIAARPEPCSPSPAVPQTCPKHRSTVVIHGQQRSVGVPSELYDHPVRSWPRELPKLAVTRGHGPRKQDPPGSHKSMTPTHTVRRKTWLEWCGIVGRRTWALFCSGSGSAW